ncbi:putative magnesium-dependent phosphatase YER134C [Monosporozyma servazzii]
MTIDYPEVAAFDLDYTVWPCYCDTHLYPPFKPVKSSNGEVLTVEDARGFQLTLYRAIPKIIKDLKENKVKIISASRTWAPEIARDLMEVFKVEYSGELVTLGTLFDASEWGERSKVGHLRDAMKKLYGTENLKKYKMCLFDDENRNRDVEKHGVKFIEVKDSDNGPSWELYQKYLSS